MDMPLSFLKRLPRRFFLFFLILSAGGIFLSLLGRELLLSRLQTALVNHAAEEYGLALSVEKVGGTLLGSLHLEGIKARRLDSRALIAALDIGSLRAEYSLFDLLRGQDAFLARTGIRVVGGDAVFDLAGSLSPDSEDDELPPEMPVALPRLSVGGFTLALLHRDTPLATFVDSGVIVGQAKAGQGWPLRLESGLVQIHSRGALSAPGRLDLLYRPEALVLQGLTVAGKPVPAAGKFVFPALDTPASFTVRIETLGGEIAGSGRLATEMIQLALRLDHLDLAALSPLLLSAGEAMGGRVSATLSSRFVPAVPEEMEGTLHVAGEGVFRGKKIAVALRAALAEGGLLIDSFKGEFAANSLELRQGTVPVAALRTWPDVAFAEMKLAHFVLRCADLPALWQLAGRPEKQLHRLPPRHSLELEGSIHDRVLRFSTGEFQTSRNLVHLERGTFALPGAGESFFQQALSGGLTLSLEDLGEVAALLAVAEMAGRVQGSLDISGTLEKPAGHFALQGKNLRYRQWSVENLRLEARADRARLRILSAEAREREDRLRLSGVWSLTRKKVESLEGELRLRDLGRYSPLWPALGPDAAGRLEARLTTRASGGQHLRLAVQEARLAGVALSSAQTGLTTSDWHHFAITRLALASPHGTMDLNGTLSLEAAQKKLTARLAHLALARNSASLLLEKPVVLTAWYGRERSLVITDSLLLRSRMGQLAASGRFSLQGENHFRIRASRFAGNGWLKEFTGPGYSFQGLDMDLALRGPFSSPRASLTATVDAFAYPQLAEPLAGRLDLAFSGDTLRVNTCDWANSRGQRIKVEGTAPFALFAEKKFLSGPLALKAQVDLPDLREIAVVLPAAATVSGAISAKITLTGSWEHPDGRLQIRANTLKLPAFRGYALPEPVTAECDLDLGRGRLLLRECGVRSPALSARLSGQWFDLPSLAALAGQGAGTLPGRLAMEGKVRVADMAWLGRQTPGLRRLGGEVEADFVVAGAAARPDFSATLLLKKGALRFNNPNIPALDGLSAKAQYAADTLRVTSLRGLLGGGPFQAQGTVFSLLRGEPGVAFTAQGENLLFFRDADMRIRGNGDLRLQGPLSRLDLSGSVAITEGRYTKNLDFLRLFRGTARPRSDIGLQVFSLREPPLRDMRIRIEVSALQPLQIRNNLARGAVRPRFSLVGTGEIPLLAGRIYVDPTRISLPAGTLVMESGIITFPENDPDRPTFDLSGRSRLAGYDISLQFQGTAEEPVITLSSMPPLPDEDLLLLVLTGQPPVKQRGTGGRSMAGMNMAVYLGKGLLASWFGNGSAETDESLLERLEVEVGRGITSSGEGTVEAQFRLVEGIFLPGDRLYITSEKDVFDDFNIGVKLVFRFR